MVCLALASAAQAATVGFQTLAAPVPGDGPMAVAVWYPSEASEADTPLALYRQSVAVDAPVSGRRHPLVVISHGTGGSLADHHDTAHALARAGFVVAALDHTGDTHTDRSRTMRITERPTQLIRLIDYMTTTWAGREAIDIRRIGAFGFSSGGFTVLGAIGGEPDMLKVAPYCAGHPRAYTCALQQGPGIGPFPASVTPVEHDKRIRAAVVAAPALGFTFEPTGLKAVTIPVQLWRAEQDTVLPHPDYAEVVHRMLPEAEYHVVPGAEHFDFMTPCSDALAKVAAIICPKSIDRTAFHQELNAEVVRFFERTLR
ncbi:MAG: alpha/beta hydrolase [Caulobacteraceae bacterium]|nr:alpha/beta hydrolase [Caulobacteraceae bacterium]